MLQSAHAVEARSLRDLSPAQWKSGIAAWLGWFFDGLDMHIYTLVARALRHGAGGGDEPGRVGGAGKELLDSSGVPDRLGAGWRFFGRAGDVLGRSRR